jgi:hypothetical protein
MVSSKVYLTRRNNGIYYLGVRQANGKIRWTSTRRKNETEARAILRASTLPLPPPVQGITLSTLLRTFVNRQRGQLRERTITDYERVIGSFIIAEGDRPITSYHLADIEDDQGRYTEKKISARLSS